ncbi:CHAT domain-containing protein [Streptomyces europaeiscabiei]|uniref:CHAT domain-containing protein n=1 Tax=Streptomyces europaeiscabiei TaxID=146819 RepID=UPI0029B5167C|nr:CHAT domain-containing protein [Streptomyces europaeiscabiei]MDX3691976.1 CHAT domain-containing protein [Streptomyces europaeiscabiei]
MGPSYLRFRANQYERARRLGGVLMPGEVRQRIVAELRQLDGADRLRIRLRLPAYSPDHAVPLSAVPWERVRLPAEDIRLRPDVWVEWAGSRTVPGTGRELRQHPTFTVVREVATAVSHRAERRADDAAAAVVVADASLVRGDITTGGGTVSLGSPTRDRGEAGDGSRVAEALARSRFDTRRVPAPATAQAIRRALPGAAVFYFGGHHISAGLVVAQSPDGADGKVLDTGELSGWLIGHGVRIAVLMACATADPKSMEARQHTALPLAERLAADGVPYVVAVHGSVSDGASARFASRFFSTLAVGTDVDVAVAEAAVEMAEPEALPVLCTAVKGATMKLRSLPTPVAVRTADVHRMPLPDIGATAVPARDERFRVCLETYLCLVGGRDTHVLADPSGADVTAAMSGVERRLYQAFVARDMRLGREDGAQERGSGLGWEEPAQWYACEAQEPRPATRSDLLNVLSPEYREPDTGAADRGPGLVIRWRVGSGTPRWSAYLRDIRRLAPEFRTVVLHVHGASAEAVREAAVRAARGLGHDEYLVMASARHRHAPGRAVCSLNGAAQVLEALRDVEEGAAVPREVRLDAASVVADLEANGGWGDWGAEHRTLESIAARWPTELPGLMTAHAYARTGAARYASLQLASADDDQMSRWLSDSGRRVPRPSDFRGVRVSELVADAVVLGLLREAVGNRSVPAELDEWEAEGLSDEVRAALVAWRRATPLNGADIGRPLSAVALERAGLLDGVDPLTLDPETRCPGSWTLLVRRPLAENDAAWLAGAQESRRRLVGLAPPAVTHDAVLERESQAFLEALRLPLPPA